MCTPILKPAVRPCTTWDQRSKSPSERSREVRRGTSIDVTTKRGSVGAGSGGLGGRAAVGAMSGGTTEAALVEQGAAGPVGAGGRAGPVEAELLPARSLQGVATPSTDGERGGLAPSTGGGGGAGSWVMSAPPAAKAVTCRSGRAMSELSFRHLDASQGMPI